MKGEEKEEGKEDEEEEDLETLFLKEELDLDKRKTGGE